VEGQLVEEFPVTSVVVKSGPVVLAPWRQVPESCPFRSCGSSSLFIITICPFALSRALSNPSPAPLYLVHFTVADAVSAFATCRQ